MASGGSALLQRGLSACCGASAQQRRPAAAASAAAGPSAAAAARAQRSGCAAASRGGEALLRGSAAPQRPVAATAAAATARGDSSSGSASGARAGATAAAALTPTTADAIVAPMVQFAGQGMDLMNYLLQQRIIFLGGPVNDGTAQGVCSALMALEMLNPNEDIKLYLNSPGGQMYSVMAIIDMMAQVKPDVSVVAFGSVMSSSTLILAAGAKGKRYSMRNARIMVNQPIGGCQGAAFDVKIQAAEQNRNLKLTAELLERFTGKPRDFVEEALDRELFLSPEQAVEMGVIDGII